MRLQTDEISISIYLVTSKETDSVVDQMAYIGVSDKLAVWSVYHAGLRGLMAGATHTAIGELVNAEGL